MNVSTQGKIKMTKSFLVLTKDRSGSKIYVNPQFIKAFYSIGNGTTFVEMDLTCGVLYVTETPEEILQIITSWR